MAYMCSLFYLKTVQQKCALLLQFLKPDVVLAVSLQLYGPSNTT